MGGFLVAYQHLGFDTVMIEGLHQAAGGYGSTTCTFTRINNKYSHGAKVVQNDRITKKMPRFFFFDPCLIAIPYL